MQSKRTDLYDMKKPELSYACLSLQGQKKWKKNVWLTSCPIPQEKTFPPSEREREMGRTVNQQSSKQFKKINK